MCGILDFDWQYGEGNALEEVVDYIKETYGSHYTNESNDIQTLDIYEARGTLADTSIDNAIKYLMRYGKKEGRNKYDLLKAIHYLLLAEAYDEKSGQYEDDGDRTYYIKDGVDVGSVPWVDDRETVNLVSDDDVKAAFVDEEEFDPTEQWK